MNVPNYLEYMMEDGGPRAHLLISHNRLINDGADMLMKLFRKELRKVCYLEQPVLTNIRQTKVAVNGHIMQGSLDWTCRVSSPMYDRKMMLAITMPIVEGYIQRPMTFEDSRGLRYALSEEGVKHAMRTPDQRRRVHMDSAVTRSLKFER